MPRRCLEDLYDELLRGSVYECALNDPQWHVFGLQVGQAVYIDPRPAILETLIHELLHRRFPGMSERAVVREARRLLTTMDPASKARWWRAYRRIKRRARAQHVQTWW